MPQTLQVGSFQHAQCLRALFFNPPAELFFHHELVKQHNVRRQFTDEVVKAAVVEFDGHFADAECSKICFVLAGAGRAAEGNVPALLQEGFEDLHDVPASR